MRANETHNPRPGHESRLWWKVFWWVAQGNGPRLKWLSERLSLVQVTIAGQIRPDTAICSGLACSFVRLKWLRDSLRSKKKESLSVRDRLNIWGNDESDWSEQLAPLSYISSAAGASCNSSSSFNEKWLADVRSSHLKRHELSEENNISEFLARINSLIKTARSGVSAAKFGKDDIVARREKHFRGFLAMFFGCSTPFEAYFSTQEFTCFLLMVYHVLESHPEQTAPLSRRDDVRCHAIGSHSALALRLHLAACSPSSSCRFWVLDHLCSNLSQSFHLCWITEIWFLNLCVCLTFSSSAFAFLIDMNFSFKSLFAIWSSSPQRFHYYFFLSIVSWQYQKYSSILILVLCLLSVTPLVCSSYSSFAPSQRDIVVHWKEPKKKINS